MGKLEVSIGSLVWKYGLCTCQLFCLSPKTDVGIYKLLVPARLMVGKKKKSDGRQLCQLWINNSDGVIQHESFHFYLQANFNVFNASFRELISSSLIT